VKQVSLWSPSELNSFEVVNVVTVNLLSVTVYDIFVTLEIRLINRKWEKLEINRSMFMSVC